MTTVMSSWTKDGRKSILLRISSITELSRSYSKVDNNGESNYIRIELFPVQLINTNWAGFLGEKNKIYLIDNSSMENLLPLAHTIQEPRSSNIPSLLKYT